MHIFFLDTASKDNVLALCTEEKTEVITHLEQRGDAELAPKIEAALSEVGWKYEDLTHLACVVGPGGFSSLRVGVTAINTLAHTLSIPVTGIHVSEIWAERVRVGDRITTEPEIRTPFLWLHSTRRTQLFMKGFGEEEDTPTLLLSLEDAKELSGFYGGELIPEHKAALIHCLPIPKDKLIPLEEVLPQFLASRQYAKAQLMPWYGREG